MKIGFVFDNMIFGGIERVGIDYIKILLKLGHEVDVYILTQNIETIINEIPKECKVKIIPFSQLLCPEKYWYVAKRWWWGKFAFPIVHIGLSLLMPFIRFFKGSQKKYDVAVAFSGHMNDLTFVANGFVKAKSKLCWLHGALYGYLLISPGFGVLYNNIENLVVLSEYLQKESLIGNRFLKCNITKIYNSIFIGTRQINRDIVEKIKSDYGKFLLMVGRFSRQKDQKTVIMAVKVLKEIYKTEITIVFVGDGPDRKDAETYAISLGVSEQCEFIGTKSDVQNYYKAANIFVHSSPIEGLPTVILEAMFFGVPVVATDSPPGVREILGDSEYGLLCRVRDPEDMARQIYRILTDEKLYNYYIQKGYERIKDFQPEVISKQLEQLLNNL